MPRIDGLEVHAEFQSVLSVSLKYSENSPVKCIIRGHPWRKFDFLGYL